jgi:hypothetical protein
MICQQITQLIKESGFVRNAKNQNAPSIVLAVNNFNVHSVIIDFIRRVLVKNTREKALKGFWIYL